MGYKHILVLKLYSSTIWKEARWIEPLLSLVSDAIMQSRNDLGGNLVSQMLEGTSIISQMCARSRTAMCRTGGLVNQKYVARREFVSNDRHFDDLLLYL